MPRAARGCQRDTHVSTPTPGVDGSAGQKNSCSGKSGLYRVNKKMVLMDLKLSFEIETSKDTKRVIYERVSESVIISYLF